MLNVSAQALRTAVIQAAMSDPAFRRELTSNPAQAIETRFGTQPYKVQVLFEKDDELSIVIPEKTEQLEKSIDRAVKDIGDRSPTRGQFDAILVQRVWSDAAFREGLKSDARGALDGLLKEYGSHVPKAKNVRIYHELEGQCVILVPSPAISADDLSDAELEAVAGGEGPVIIGSVAGAIVTVIVCEWICS